MNAADTSASVSDPDDMTVFYTQFVSYQAHLCPLPPLPLTEATTPGCPTTPITEPLEPGNEVRSFVQNLKERGEVGRKEC